MAESEKSDGPEIGDADLIRNARSGDRRAFGILVRRYQRRVYGVGKRMLGTREDAEDLVQETFVRAWKSLDRFDEGRPLAPWLIRIATNGALTLLETRRRRPVEELDETLADGGAQPDHDTDRRRLQKRIRAELDRLPDDQRAILVLRAVDGLSYREIADTLDIPMGTVMSRLSRARDTMRKRMER